MRLWDHQTYLDHVSAPHELGPEVEVLSLGLLQVQDEGVVGDLEIALVRVEDDGLLSVEFLLHLHSDPVDGRLEVGLLSVHHDAHIHVLGSLVGCEGRKASVRLN